MVSRYHEQLSCLYSGTARNQEDIMPAVQKHAELLRLAMSYSV